jgi:hypothetical protein
MATKANGKRELINPNADKHYIRSDESGQFDENDDVSRSLSQDVRHEANTAVPAGQGDRGNQRLKK